jgi:hypothetical protein
VLFFWGGSAIGVWTGHWHSALSIADYRNLISK